MEGWAENVERKLKNERGREGVMTLVWILRRVDGC
jgi:hypothetical protein